MDSAQIAQVIEKAKAGDHQAKNCLVHLLQDDKYMGQIKRYLHMNRLLEPEEVVSEFWVGVILAIPKVISSNKGDPLHYLAWSGLNQVKRTLRRNIGKGVEIICIKCGHKGNLYRHNKEYNCSKCGSTEYETHQREINLSILKNPNDEEEDSEFVDRLKSIKPGQLLIDVQIDYEFYLTQLAPKEREVLSLLIGQEMDKEHEKNYLQTIADIMQISNQCVVQYLKRIRSKLDKFKDEGK